MEKPCIQITLFGKLTISYQKDSIELTQTIGKQLVTLFEMLVYYRKDNQVKDRIISTIWADKENPANLMKFSIFRLRNYLKSIPFLSELNLIVTGKNGYQLNPCYQYQIDCEQFVEKLKLLQDNEFDEHMLKHAIALFDIYEGDMYQGDGEAWARQINTFYRSMYLENVKKVGSYFLQTKAYERILPIVEKATRLYPQHEDAHYLYLKACVQMKEYEKARRYYQDLTKRFVDTYKIAPSNRLQKLYHVILSNCDTRIEIEEIQEQLQYAKQIEHAFYCEYDVFEYLYHVALRQQGRLKKPMYLIVFNLSECPEHQEGKVMNKLKKAIVVTMRSSDIFTKLNKLQYAALVYCDTKEDVEVAVNRVLTQFNNDSHHLNGSLSYVSKRVV